MEAKDSPVFPVFEENTNEAPVFEEKEASQDVITERRIVFTNLELYKDAIMGFKGEIYKLVKEGVIHEQTALSLALKHELGFFDQIVDIQYK